MFKLKINALKVNWQEKIKLSYLHVKLYFYMATLILHYYIKKNTAFLIDSDFNHNDGWGK